MKKMGFLLYVVLATTLVLACSALPKRTSMEQPSYKIWDELLAAHVNEKGLVDYKGFIQDSAKLNRFLEELSTHAPNPKTWSKEERLAFWINAYNAFTIKLILKHYPVESIKDIGPEIQITRINTPWQIEFFSIGGTQMNLDNIEHGIIREKFNDPRIHFALVCAARSCPSLRNEAYTASELDEQLNDQGRKFLANAFKNKISPDKLQLSMYFKWYKGDFTQDQSLISFLNQFAPVKINPDASISYIDYNWELNEQ